MQRGYEYAGQRGIKKVAETINRRFGTAKRHRKVTNNKNCQL